MYITQCDLALQTIVLAMLLGMTRKSLFCSSAFPLPWLPSVLLFCVDISSPLNNFPSLILGFFSIYIGEQVILPFFFLNNHLNYVCISLSLLSRSYSGESFSHVKTAAVRVFDPQNNSEVYKLYIGASGAHTGCTIPSISLSLTLIYATCPCSHTVITSLSFLSPSFSEHSFSCFCSAVSLILFYLFRSPSPTHSITNSDTSLSFTHSLTQFTFPHITIAHSFCCDSIEDI